MKEKGNVFFITKEDLETLYTKGKVDLLYPGWENDPIKLRVTNKPYEEP